MKNFRGISKAASYLWQYQKKETFPFCFWEMLIWKLVEVMFETQYDPVIEASGVSWRFLGVSERLGEIERVV